MWSVQEAIPPMMSFHVGSLGFLTHFVYENYQQDIRRVIEGNVLLKSIRVHLALGKNCCNSAILRPKRIFKAQRRCSPRLRLMLANKVTLERMPRVFGKRARAVQFFACIQNDIQFFASIKNITVCVVPVTRLANYH